MKKKKMRDLVDVKYVRKKDGIHMIEDWKLNVSVLKFLRSEFKRLGLMGIKYEDDPE